MMPTHRTVGFEEMHRPPHNVQGGVCSAPTGAPRSSASRSSAVEWDLIQFCPSTHCVRSPTECCASDLLQAGTSESSGVSNRRTALGLSQLDAGYCCTVVFQRHPKKMLMLMLILLLLLPLLLLLLLLLRRQILPSTSD